MVKKQQGKPEIKMPKNLDPSRMKQAGEQIVRENKKWLKEMADK